MNKIELSQAQLDEILQEPKSTSKVDFGDKIRQILANKTPTGISQQIIYTQEQLDSLNI